MKVAPTTRPATPGGCTIALAVLMPLTTTVIVALVTILIIIAKKLKDARYTLILKPSSACSVTPPVCLTMCSLLSRTQLGKLSEPQTNQVYDTPALAHYENVSKTDVGGASDHTYTPAMELSQCPAYAPTEVSTRRGRRRDMREEGIYENQ